MNVDVVYRFLRIESLGAGRARVTLGATIIGPASGLDGLMFGKNIAGYMPTAVRQLLARAEEGSALPN